jgi:hypothetical protein
MTFINSTGGQIDINFEQDEIYLVRKYLPKNATVLELGARYGTVSCEISKILENPSLHVAVEPDISVIESLQQNKTANGGMFHIYNGVISKNTYELKKLDCCEYGNYTILSDNPTTQNKTFKELETCYAMNFDTLVADCEGFLPIFIEENPEILDKFRCIIYEKDGIPFNLKKYTELDELFIKKGFTMIESLPHPKWSNNPHYNSAWIKLP